MSQKPKNRVSTFFEKLFGSNLDTSDTVMDALDIHEDAKKFDRKATGTPPVHPLDSHDEDEDSYTKYVERHKQMHMKLHQKVKEESDETLTSRISQLTEHVPDSEDRGENMRILLVRHAESEGNLDKSVWTTTPDYNIPLSENGIKQAQQAGKIIKQFYEKLYTDLLDKWKIDCANVAEGGILPEKPCIPKVVLWTSPYKRTRQTTDEICKVAGEYILEIREHIVLGEQQFGLFEGFDVKELQKFFPVEMIHFTKCVEFGGRFWARPPLGESRFDVATRVQGIFPKLLRDAEKSNIRNAIIVSHGVTIRAFCMMWLNRTPEWFEQDNNPDNVAIRCIDKCHDKGYIFDGFKPSKRSIQSQIQTSIDKKE
jgi:2,3-bisphosphoglycerate-dependent phosphoglycerate mutase